MKSYLLRLALISLVVLGLLAVASGVWASPTQRDLRQTVPTRTPTKAPSPTAEPPTATPVPPTATPIPPTATPQPTQPPAAQLTAAPTEQAKATATSAAAGITGYPVAGADHTPWLWGALLGLTLALGAGWYSLRRRRGATSGR